MSDDYIQQLEEENDRLRDALTKASQMLDENWENSLSLGLIPDLHYREITKETKVRTNRKTFKSLRLLREWIHTHHTTDKDIYLKLHDVGGNQTIYNFVSIFDSDHDEPIKNYYVEYALINKKKS